MVLIETMLNETKPFLCSLRAIAPPVLSTNTFGGKWQHWGWLVPAYF